MRLVTWRSLSTATLFALSMGLAPTYGQTDRPPDGGNREVLISILIPSLPNAPFSATVNTESIRQLSSGASITLKSHRAIPRGRIFQERRMLVPEDGKHESVLTQIEIRDPVAHQLYICIPKENTCQLEDFTTPSFAPPRVMSEKSAPDGAPSFQSLGKQLIEGVETFGAREIGIIEVGAIGNDSPIEVQREYCYAPTLGVNLLSKLQAPRVGIQNFELSDVSLAEPDPKLFRIDQNMRVIDLREHSQPAPPSR